MGDSNQRVVIEMKCSDVFIADFIGMKDNILKISNVTNLRTNQKTDSDIFNSEDVISISQLLKDEDSELLKLDASHVDLRAIGMPCDLFQNHIQMIFNYKFIDMVNQKYSSAIEELNEAESISLVGLGYTYYRRNKMSLMVVATIKTIYLFDIFSLKNEQMIYDLQNIFENDEIEKIMHGPCLFDYFKRHFQITIKNVFDTQIADLLLRKGDKRNVAECLEEYFNIPKSLLNDADEHIYDKEWNQRPLDYDEKIRACQLVVFLWELKDYFKKVMLNNAFNREDIF